MQSNLPKVNVSYFWGDFRVHKISLISDTFLLIVGWNADKTSCSTDTNFETFGTTANWYSVIIINNPSKIIIIIALYIFLFLFALVGFMIAAPLWFDGKNFEFNHFLIQLFFMAGKIYAELYKVWKRHKIWFTAVCSHCKAKRTEFACLATPIFCH